MNNNNDIVERLNHHCLMLEQDAQERGKNKSIYPVIGLIDDVLLEMKTKDARISELEAEVEQLRPKPVEHMIIELRSSQIQAKADELGAEGWMITHIGREWSYDVGRKVENLRPSKIRSVVFVRPTP